MDFSRRLVAEEWMDTERVDDADFSQCLADLATVNRLTLAARPTMRFLHRVAKARPPGSPLRVLDVGFGQGDMLRLMHAALIRWGVTPVLCGIDLNPGSTAAARAATPVEMNIRFETGDVFSYVPDTRPHLIVSSLFTHHLTDRQVVDFLVWMHRTAREGWFVNDLRRHPVAYHGFRALSTVLRWHRFVRHDGPVSVARAFVPADWARFLSEAGTPGRIEPMFPYRLCVSFLTEAT